MLSRVLTREVKIGELSVAIGASSSGVLYPYDLLASNAFIADKLANFNGLRAGLRIHVRVSATAFHYGALQFGYIPLHNLRSTGVFDVTTFAANMQLSQCPSSGMLPLTGSSAIEMLVPYIYVKDYISLRGEFSSEFVRETSATTLQNVGALYWKTLSPLQNASTGINNVTVYITASFVDPKVSLPTTQSNEAADGPISYVASSVAKVAGYAEKFKPVARYARATREIASHLGGIARVLGFSRPMNLDPPNTMKPEFFGSLANTDQNETCHPVSFDSQCELGVTPDVVRLDIPDELNVEHFCARESYVNKISWAIPSTVAAAPDVWIPVTPQIIWSENSITYTTPCGHAARLFTNWRGMMVYRLKMVKSGVHTGRLQIRHDALSSTAGTASSITELKTTFWNLCDSDEVEICVPWLQGSQFLPLRSSDNANDDGVAVTTIPTESIYYNGMLQISVVSDLVCSSTSTSAIEMLVYARLEQAEFMGGSNAISLLSLPETQSGCEPSHQVMNGCSDPSNFSIYGGEQIVSFRNYLRRYCSFYMEHYVEPSRDLVKRNFSRFPRAPGLVPAGTGRDTVALTDDSFMYQFVPMSYMATCFALERGSVRYKAVLNKTTDSQHIDDFSLTRNPIINPGFHTQVGVTNLGGSTYIHTVSWNTLGGGAGRDKAVDVYPMLETNVPHYNTGYASVAMPKVTKGMVLDNTAFDNVELSYLPAQTTSDLTYNLFVAAGSDYGLYYFTFVPGMTYYSTLAPVV